MKNRTLFIIPARYGSKGLPGKNIRTLGEDPLFIHSIKYAEEIKNDDDVICFASNDLKALDIANEYGYATDYKRPDALSEDNTPTEDVILDVIKFYAEKGESFERIVLLQPTSPYRNTEHYKEMDLLYSNTIDMVVSVNISKQNPYFNLFEEENGLLFKSKPSSYTRRQDAPAVYQYNGSIYIINTESILKHKKIASFNNIVKYVMAEKYSIDIDSELDFMIAEHIMKP